MEERAIYISSTDREKVGKSETHNFKIKLRETLKLDLNMRHEIAIDKVMMTYSWHNVSDQYKNNKIKCSTDNGQSWETLNFVDGMYSYDDLNDYIHQYMDKKNHKTGDKFNINILFVLSTYRVVIEIDNNYRQPQK